MTEQIQAKKKKVNGKAKGNGYEGKIAKLFSTTFAPLQFRRSQSSGAILGGQNEKYLEQYSFEVKRAFIGDVVPTNESEVTNPDFNFSVECKFYKDVETLENLITKKTKIIGWMEESNIDAKKLNKQPILIFKFNRTSDYVAITRDQMFPTDVEFLTLTDGTKIALLDDVIKHVDWWISAKIK
jgi:hypothetical protein